MCGIWVEVGIAQSDWMPDANLRAAVLEKLKDLNIVADSATTFTQANMAHTNFTSLSAPRKKISDITGLEYATSLITLSLYRNSISTIPDLSGLTSLTTLTLYRNSITTIPTTLPTSLTTLSFYYNQISTIPDLSSLSSLTELNLNDNSVTAIPTSLPSSLTKLHLRNNSINEIPNLSSLSSLTTLYISGNKISEIPVTDLPANLQTLNLNDNSISEIPNLSSLSSLTTLYLSNNRISEIPVTNLPSSLTDLDLGGNSISEIPDLSSLSNLIALRLYNNKISDISEVSKLTLTNLELQRNSISDISPLAGHSSLQTSILSNNPISEIPDLSGLTMLISLYLVGHRITDVSQLEKLSHLGALTYLALDSSYANRVSILNDPEALRDFLYMPPPPPSPPVDTMPPVEAAPEILPKRKIIMYQCPVGWQRTDGFAQPNPRVLIYEVNLEMDLHNRVSIYKPNSVAIYVHPDEALENLDGWKLKVAVPYNLHRDYLLTAENSVVVDANIEGVEGGFAFIESPEESPFPMVGMGFTGATVPGFDYRLYDDTGRKVDFGIACYKQGGIFQALKDMEDPRVLRNVLLERLDWDAATYIRSEWTVPTPAPAAPSLVKKTVVGTWADLKKQ